jgi:hypothetical protein
MLDAAGEPDIAIVQDESRIRGKEPFRITGNNDRLVSDTGWAYSIPIEKTLSDLVSYWIAELGKS